MQKKNFKPGETVELKTGSLPFTVVRYDLTAKVQEDIFFVYVTWFDNRIRRIGRFKEDLLQKRSV